jgi:hypothetical protein
MKMFDNLKKSLYFNKAQLLLNKGLEDGSIKPFDNEFYEKMNHTYISCLPVSMHIKYLKPILSQGKCYDRSLYMFFCFEKAVLVHGYNKDLELRYGRDNAGHGWIEMDGYCYDPSLLLRFKKEIYYEIYRPYNVTKITTDEYKNCCDYNRQFYEDVVKTKLSDFQPNGSKRIDLCVVIPLVQGIAEMETNENFKRELNEYLELIQYDEIQVYEEMNTAFQKCLKKYRI